MTLCLLLVSNNSLDAQQKCPMYVISCLFIFIFVFYALHVGVCIVSHVGLFVCCLSCCIVNCVCCLWIIISWFFILKCVIIIKWKFNLLKFSICVANKYLIGIYVIWRIVTNALDAMTLKWLVVASLVLLICTVKMCSILLHWSNRFTRRYN